MSAVTAPLTRTEVAILADMPSWAYLWADGAAVRDASCDEAAEYRRRREAGEYEVFLGKPGSAELPGPVAVTAPDRAGKADEATS